MIAARGRGCGAGAVQGRGQGHECGQRGRVLRLIHRSNIKPKCGNNTFLCLHDLA